MNEAYAKAAVSTTIVSAFTAGGILLGNRVSPTFRKFITPAGKIGFIVMAGMGTFVLKTQHNLTQIHRSRAWQKTTHPPVTTKMRPIEERRNTLYDQCVDIFAENHFYVLGAAFGVALPILGYHFSKQTHIKVSQRAMHTRVAFQGTAIGIVLLVAMLNYGARSVKESRALE
jgi:hypothetical protein